MKLVCYEPDALIEIDDMHGFRKLAFVDETGMAYVDLIDDNATAWPIYEALHPATVGNSLSWGLEILDQQPTEARAFNRLHQRLLDADLDSLTLTRALYSAYRTRTYDYAATLTAGVAATDQVRRSRGALYQLVKRGRTSHLHVV